MISRSLGFAALFFAAGLASGGPTRRLALIVGANDGGRDRVRLQYAVSDAVTFAGSMRELGGVEAQDILLLRDPPVEVMEEAFVSLHRQASAAKRNGERVEVVVFYSGHADEHGLLLHGERFAFDRFRSEVDGLPAEVRIAVVDACASGALIKRKGGRVIPAFLADEWEGNFEEESQYHWLHLKAEADFQGMQFTWGYNRADKRYEGEQFAFLANAVGSSMHGVQAAGIYNTAQGQVRGGQVSGFSNYAADDLRGLQFSTGINIAHSMSQGVQIGGSVNYVGGSATGVQSCTFLNLTRGSFSGFQGGMGINYVGSRFKGVQFFNVLNWVGGAVEGYQLGIINIAKSYETGTPIGLLNFIGDGTWRGETWLDETGFYHYGLITGSRVMNTRIALGQNTSTPAELGALSLEAAGHFELTRGPRFFLEPGLMGTVMGHEAEEIHPDIPDMLTRLRMTLGADLGPYISLAGGVSWACLFTPSDRPPMVGRMAYQSHYFHNQFHMWPGLHASIRIGTYGHR